MSCRVMIHGTYTQHGGVEVGTVEHVNESVLFVLHPATYLCAGLPDIQLPLPEIRKVPQAGSQIISLGVGAVTSTIILIMCRGVRN